MMLMHGVPTHVLLQGSCHWAGLHSYSGGVKRGHLPLLPAETAYLLHVTAS